MAKTPDLLQTVAVVMPSGGFLEGAVFQILVYRVHDSIEEGVTVVRIVSRGQGTVITGITNHIVSLPE